MTTPIYAVPDWSGSQSSPWLIVNQAARVHEAVMRGSVLDRDLTAPPGTCADGATYLVAATATGAWAAKDGLMAIANGTNAASGWLFAAYATEGRLLYVEDEAALLQYSSAAWAAFSGGGGAATYILPLFFTTTPTAGEVLLLHKAGAAFTIPADFTAALESHVGTNPTATFDLTVAQNGATIGTISVSTSGVVTATTTSGTAKTIAQGDLITITGPGTADTTAANMAFTIIGER